MTRLFRKNQWWLQILLGIVFLAAMIWLKKISYGQEQITNESTMNIIISPNSIYPGIYPGDIVRFEIVNIPKGAKIWGLEAWTDFNGKIFQFFWYQSRLMALIPITLDQKQAKITFPISIEGGGYKFTEFTHIEIKSKTWPEKQVPEYPPLNSEQLARLTKEKSLIKKALGETAPHKIWLKSFQSPLSELIETSPFGQKRINSIKIRQHRGTDFRASKGTPVRAMNDGYVILFGNYLFDGGIVIVDHGLGLSTLYLHMSKVIVRKGQFVKRGRIIGRAGKTGIAYGPHLHLEVRLNGEPVNPLQILEILKEKR